MDPNAESVFETDFWKDAVARKSWDDLVPGEPRPTILYLLTLEAIQRYCRSVGDQHPLADASATKHARHYAANFRFT